MKVSRTLIYSAGMDIMAGVIKEVLSSMGAALDKAALLSDGTGSSTKGALNISGTNSITFGAASSFPALLAMQTPILATNPRLNSLAWIASNPTREKLMQKPKATAGVGFCWEKGSSGDEIAGWPVYAEYEPGCRGTARGRRLELVYFLYLGSGCDPSRGRQHNWRRKRANKDLRHRDGGLCDRKAGRVQRFERQRSAIIRREKSMSKPHETILGAVKKVRAIRDLVYQGKEYRGRHRERVDEKNGSYYFAETHAGDEFECDAVFAKQAEDAGEIVLLSGGRVTVIEQKDGLHIYKNWLHNLSDPEPVFERCELLRVLSFGDGCLLPVGFKCRLDTATFFDRSRFCYQDETQSEFHTVRVLKASPKRIKLDATELSNRVGVMWKKLYPDEQTAAT